MGREFEEAREATRAIVHDFFSLSAVPRSHDGSTILPAINVRLHRNLRKPFGDLDREGFALVMELQNQVIIDREEWFPLRNWLLDFGKHGQFNIDVVNDEAEERFVPCVVSEHTP